MSYKKSSAVAQEKESQIRVPNGGNTAPYKKVAPPSDALPRGRNAHNPLLTKQDQVAHGRFADALPEGRPHSEAPRHSVTLPPPPKAVFRPSPLEEDLLRWAVVYWPAGAAAWLDKELDRDWWLRCCASAFRRRAGRDVRWLDGVLSAKAAEVDALLPWIEAGPCPYPPGWAAWFAAVRRAADLPWASAPAGAELSGTVVMAVEAAPPRRKPPAAGKLF